MNTSRFSFVSFSVLTVALIGLAGCADTITFSKDSREHGLQLMQKQEYAEAAGAFKNGVHQNPTDYESYFYLGQCYEKLNQRHDAIAAYKTCLDEMAQTLQGRDDIPFRQNVLNALAQSIASSDTTDAEINAIEQKARSRTVAEDYFLLGKIYAFRGDADSAIDAYNRASRLDPTDFYIAKEYGLYLERIGQNNQALPLLKKAYAMDTRDQQLAQALRRLGVVPGPSLKEENALAKPVLPQGPIPPVEDWGGTSSSNAKPITPSPSPTAQTPRD